MKRVSLALVLLIAGCDSGKPPAPTAALPKLDLVDFFTGDSIGKGRIEIWFQRDKALRVVSRGRPDARGGLILDQRIGEGAKVRQRRWVMHCASNGRCDGTLTDASGPVRVKITGNTAHIRYRMPNRLDVEQWLVLRPDRLTIDNRLRVSKWGLTIATVDEVIRRARQRVARRPAHAKGSPQGEA